MQTQPVILNSQQIDSIIKSLNYPQFNEGIYLVKRKSVYAPLIKEHYGFVVSGRFLKFFNLSENKAKVINKNDSGVFADDFDPFSWQVVYKMPENEIPLAILRTKLSLKDRYNLLFDNCEHFARFVTTGNKEST